MKESGKRSGGDGAEAGYESLGGACPVRGENQNASGGGAADVSTGDVSAREPTSDAMGRVTCRARCTWRPAASVRRVHWVGGAGQPWGRCRTSCATAARTASAGGIDPLDREFCVDHIVTSGMTGSYRNLATSSKSDQEAQWSDPKPPYIDH